MVFSLLHIFSFMDYQSWNYKSVDQNIRNKYLKAIDDSQIPTKAYDLTLSLPKGFVKDGTVDYTRYLQNAINAHPIAVMPPFPVLININGLQLPSNSVLYFKSKSLLQYRGQTTSVKDDILKIYDKMDVTVYNARINGNRKFSDRQAGQWNAGISIINSQNVQIINPQISNTWGDGIFIGSENGKFSENVRVNGGWIDSARRNGISITSAKNSVVNNILISNTNGHDPQCGIDVEPSWDKDVIENINIQNVYTYNNKLAGISVNMSPLGVDNINEQKKISLLISNHTDNGSQFGFLTSFDNVAKKYNAIGSVKIENSNWRLSKKPYWRNKTQSNIELRFQNVQINPSSAIDFKEMTNDKNIIFSN